MCMGVAGLAAASAAVCSQEVGWAGLHTEEEGKGAGGGERKPQVSVHRAAGEAGAGSENARPAQLAQARWGLS